MCITLHALSGRFSLKLFSNSFHSNENNLIYFRTQLGNKGKQKSLVVESCSCVPKSRGDWGSIMLNFWRLTTVILDYLQYRCPLPYLTSIFCVTLKVYLTHHCIWQVRLNLIVSCVAHSISNQDSLLSKL